MRGLKGCAHTICSHPLATDELQRFVVDAAGPPRAIPEREERVYLKYGVRIRGSEGWQ